MGSTSPSSAPQTPSTPGGGGPPFNPPGKSWLARIWSDFDNRYMKPFLTHSSPCLMETMPECCLPITRLLTSQVRNS